MQNTEIDSLTVGLDQSLMTMTAMLEDPSANASSLGLSDAFCREFINAPLFGDELDFFNELGLPGPSNAAGPASSAVQPNEQFAPEQPQQLEQALVTTAEVPTQDEVPQLLSSIGSLFDSLDTPEKAPATPWRVNENTITPPTTGKRTKKSSSQISKKSTPRSKTSRLSADLKNHKILNSVHLPQAVATPQEYADHVSLFAPIDASERHKTQLFGKLGQTRRRLDVMSQELKQHRETLRMTSTDPATGKNKIETLEGEIQNLRRVITDQSNINKRMKNDMIAERKRFSELAYQYNVMLHDYHKVHQENEEIKTRLESS